MKRRRTLVFVTVATALTTCGKSPVEASRWGHAPSICFAGRRRGLRVAQPSGNGERHWRDTQHATLLSRL